FFFFSSRRRHTRFSRDWSSDVCSSDLQHRRSHPMTQPIYSAPIELAQPVKRGHTEVKEIALRRPGSGELRGLKLADLVQGDVTEIGRASCRGRVQSQVSH